MQDVFELPAPRSVLDHANQASCLLSRYLAAWFLSQVGSTFSGVNLLGSSAWVGASVHKRTPSVSKDLVFIVISLQRKETLGFIVAEIGIFKSTTFDILMVPLCWVAL